MCSSLFPQPDTSLACFPVCSVSRPTDLPRWHFSSCFLRMTYSFHPWPPTIQLTIFSNSVGKNPFLTPWCTFIFPQTSTDHLLTDHLSNGTFVLFIFTCVCLYEYMPCMCRCPQRPEENIRSPGSEVTGDCNFCYFVPTKCLIWVLGQMAFPWSHLSSPLFRLPIKLLNSIRSESVSLFSEPST